MLFIKVATKIATALVKKGKFDVCKDNKKRILLGISRYVIKLLYYILFFWCFKTVCDPYSAIEATELRGTLLRNEPRLLYKQERLQKTWKNVRFLI